MAGHGGHGFFRRDTAISAADAIVLNTAHQSVGLIQIESLEDGQRETTLGTGFLIGDGFLMTAYHLFENKIEHILETIDHFLPEGERRRHWCHRHFLEGRNLPEHDLLTKYLERKKYLSFDIFRGFIDSRDDPKVQRRLTRIWNESCHVTFWSYIDTEKKMKDLPAFFFSLVIPFADRENDVIILKLEADSSRSDLPQSLVLDSDYERENRVSIYGYLKVDGSEELHLDPQCKVYLDKEELRQDIKRAQIWWENKESEVDRNAEYKRINFSEEFRKCGGKYNQEHGCMILHASKSFVQGTSGSPLLVIRRVGNTRKPVVAGMYLRGYPSFYYKLQNSIYTHQPLRPEFSHYNKFREFVSSGDQIPWENFFEAGITMERVEAVLGQHSSVPCLQSLRQNIFEKWRQQAPHQPEAGSHGDWSLPMESMEVDQMPSLPETRDGNFMNVGGRRSETYVKSRYPPAQPTYRPLTSQTSLPSIDGPTEPDFTNFGSYDSDAAPGGDNASTWEATVSDGKRTMYQIHHDHGGGAKTVIQYDKKDNPHIQIGNFNKMVINEGGSTKTSERKKKTTQKDSALKASATPVTQSHLDTVANKIGKSGKRLARQLNFPNSRIEQIEMDYHHEGSYEITYQILKEWKNRNAGAATVGELVKALLVLEQTDIVKELEKIVRS